MRRGKDPFIGVFYPPKPKEPDSFISIGDYTKERNKEFVTILKGEAPMQVLNLSMPKSKPSEANSETSGT